MARIQEDCSNRHFGVCFAAKYYHLFCWKWYRWYLLFYRCHCEPLQIAIHTVFTAWCYAQRGLCRRKMSVSPLSVCSSDTCRSIRRNCYIYILKQSVTTGLPRHSVFPNGMTIFRRGPPDWSVKCKGVWKNRDFRPIGPYLALARKWYKMEP